MICVFLVWNFRVILLLGVESFLMWVFGVVKMLDVVVFLIRFIVGELMKLVIKVFVGWL